MDLIRSSSVISIMRVALSSPWQGRSALYTSSSSWILAGSKIHSNQNYWYSTLILIATLGYAFNVNIIKKHLSDISALAVTTGNFLFIFLPAVVVLYFSGFFEAIATSKEMQEAAAYIVILSLFGTAIAKVLFNKMVQISSPVFASSVTYTMPMDCSWLLQSVREFDKNLISSCHGKHRTGRRAII